MQEDKRVYFVHISANVLVRGNETQVSIFPAWTTTVAHADVHTAREQTADNPNLLQDLAGELARFGCLTGKYEDMDYHVLSKGLDVEERDFYAPLFESLRKFILSEGIDGCDFLDETVDFHMGSIDIAE